MCKLKGFIDGAITEHRRGLGWWYYRSTIEDLLLER